MRIREAESSEPLIIKGRAKEIPHLTSPETHQPRPEVWSL